MGCGAAGAVVGCGAAGAVVGCGAACLEVASTMGGGVGATWKLPRLEGAARVDPAVVIARADIPMAVPRHSLKLWTFTI